MRRHFGHFEISNPEHRIENLEIPKEISLSEDEFNPPAEIEIPLDDFNPPEEIEFTEDELIPR